jgi:DNA-binding MarR family transcriptional regulator
MAIKELSPNERIVFHALVRHPSLNDRELSEKVGVKLSTVTAIKNRLKARGFFLTVRIPQLQHLGCELVTVNYAHLNTSIAQGKRVEVGRALLADFPEIFYLASDERVGFALSFNHNYTTARSNTERFFRVYSENEFLLPEGYEAVHFPFSQSRLYNTFECAHLLAVDFGISEREERRSGREASQDNLFESVNPVELTRIEKKVLRGLVAYPDLHDSSVAKQIDVTRQTVTKMRKRFESLGLLKTVRVPNLLAMGYEVLAIIHERYRPSQTLDQRREVEEPFFEGLPVTYRIAADLEAIEILAFHDFKEFQQTSVRISRFNREQKFIAREADTLVFSLADLYPIKNHVYSRAVDRILLPELG